MKNSSNKILKIYSPHSTDECYSRIKNAVAIPFVKSPKAKLVYGEASPAKFRLTKNMKYRNIFQTVLSASLETHGDGTIIHGVIGLQRLVKFSLSICFGLMFLYPIFFLLLSYFGPKRPMVSVVLMAAITLLLIILLGVVLERISEYFSPGESDFLKKFLIDLLDAEEL